MGQYSDTSPKDCKAWLLLFYHLTIRAAKKKKKKKLSSVQTADSPHPPRLTVKTVIASKEPHTGGSVWFSEFALIIHQRPPKDEASSVISFFSFILKSIEIGFRNQEEMYQM